MNKFFKIIITVLFTLASVGCGKTCNTVNRLFNEPACHNLTLDASKIFSPLIAACGAPSSRKVSVSCPPGTGTNAQCTYISDQFPLIVLLVANNAGGNFMDADSTVYTNCTDLFSAVNSSLVQDVAGIFISNGLTPSDTLACTDGGGCVMAASGSCISGWDTITRTPLGTAVLPAAGSYLACVYIDNSSIITPPAPAAVGNWSLPMIPLTITGTVTFGVGAGWVDQF